VVFPDATCAQTARADGVSHTEQLDRWQPEVLAAAQRFGIPPDWIYAVMRVESGGQTERNGRPITSPKGAMGLMQLMPATYAEMRSLYGLGGDPYAPADNILAGAAYLRLNLDRFGYPGLFAAYNAGPKRYLRSLSGIALPPETRAYLTKIVPATLPKPEKPDTVFVAVNDPSLPDEQPEKPSVFVPLSDR
jgi:soluble lytic murein transglycosylase-like protein